MVFWTILGCVATDAFSGHADRVRISLLTYSTKPRGGVVHTLALAEALARAGAEVTVWTLARGGDQAFFRPIDLRSPCARCPSPRSRARR